MYIVKYGKEYLHDPNVDNCLLIDLSLDGEENTCGYCDFTIYPSHPIYDKLRERDTENPIEVYDDDILLFKGFIYELGKEFYLDGHVKCKGDLAYLTESIVRPYSTLVNGYGAGRQPPTSVDGFFEWLITQHNEQVKSNKRFKVGINQGADLDANNYIYRESTKYPSTWKEISEKLLDDLGGYLRVRYEDDTRYIDYLSEWVDTNIQILDFGINLTDYTQTDDSDSIATFVVPLGARMSDTEYSYNDGYYKTIDTSKDPDKEYYTLGDNGYTKVNDDVTSFETGVTYYEHFDTFDESDLSLTIEGLDDKEYSEDYRKSGDIIYCESAVQKYGWIGVTYENTDITTKEQLVSRSIVALKELISPKRTIELKAVDMHLVNPDIKPIRIGEYVRVRSKPHNIDSYFLCTSIDLDLNNPENSLYTLGTTFDTLTGQQNKRIKLLNATINQTYEKAEKLSEQEKKNAAMSNTAIKKANEAKVKADKASAKADVTNEQLAETKEEIKETYATNEKVDNLPIVGKNLVLLSNPGFSNDEYNIANFDLSESMIPGDTYTIQIWGQLGDGKTEFELYIGQGIQSCGIVLKTDNTYGSLTFVCPKIAGEGEYRYDQINIYTLPQSVTADCFLDKVKLEKGDKATEWSSAPEDMLSKSEAKTTYTSQTDLTQMSEEIRMDFRKSIYSSTDDMQSQLNESNTQNANKFTEINRYIRFVDGKIVLGDFRNELVLTIQNDRVSFTQGGNEVAYFSNNKLYIKQAEVLTTLKVGNYAFTPRNDGGLALRKRVQ